MNPDELKALLSSLNSAADVVEAIDDPCLQSRRGWDLTGWNYVPVPWGVQFTHVNFPQGINLGIEVSPKHDASGGQHEV